MRQGSVQSLRTALQAFLHLLPTSLLLWLTTDVGPLTVEAAQSSLVSAVLVAIQARSCWPCSLLVQAYTALATSTAASLDRYSEPACCC